MSNFKSRIILVILLFSSISVLAQTLPFKTFTVDDGLPQSSVMSMIQDHRGYIWFGTQNGICRFNGLEFRAFTRHDGIAEVRIFAILEDTQGNIWAGTQTSGLYRYNGQTWTHLPIHDSLLHNTVYALEEGPDGTIWAGTPDGLCRIDGDQVTVIDESAGRLPGAVRAIRRDQRGHMWFASRSGISRFDGTTWQTFTPATTGLPLGQVVVISCDHAGGLWFGLAGTGSGVLRYAAGMWDRATDAPALSDLRITTILPDRDGHLWLGTADGGVACYDGRHCRILSEEQGLPSKSVMSMIQDREGNLWFGTMAGAAQLASLKFESYTTTEGLPDNTVWSIAESPRGEILLGLNTGGVVRLTGSGWRNYPLPAWLEQTSNRVILFTRKGDLWIGTGDAGAARRQGTEWNHFRPGSGLAGAMVYAIIEARDGAVWIGTNRGASRYADGVWTTFTAANGLTGNTVTDVFQDSRGDIWLATIGGLDRLRNGQWTHYTSAQGLPDKQVLGVSEDPQGAIWVATFGGGIARYDSDGFTVYSSADGLSNDFCYYVMPVGDYLYIGTNNGLNRFDGHRFKVYTSRDGLAASEMNKGSFLRDSRGTLWIGTVGGITRFRPELDTPNLTPPPVYITRISLFDKPVTPGGELSFPHHRNYLRFDFFGINYTAPRSVLYRYRLQGISEQWLTTRQRSIAFPYLPPGEYVFEVSARNNDGVWSHHQATTMFTIRPPFWSTWWFRGLLLALAGFGLYFIRWYELRSIRERSRLLKEMVHERTLELEAKTRLLEESNLRLQELDKLKSKFLATVSHELRTPLTSIRAFAEILMDNENEQPDTRLRFLGIINDESERLTRLIDDLLDLSRIESGRQNWNMQPVEPDRIIRAAIDATASLFSAGKLSLATDLPDHLPRIRGDFDRLVQVMTNLIGNAVKFTPVGGQITVSARLTSSASFPAVRIDVIDTGQGIPEDQLELIFEKFHQVCPDSTRKQAGTGLGLAICQEIILQHGGRIWAESRPGAGSTFCFTLPVANPVNEPMTRASSTTTPDTTSSTRTGPIPTPDHRDLPTRS